MHTHAHVHTWSAARQVSVERGQPALEAPLDFAIVVAWKAIMGALLKQRVDADMLRLVHLSNSYRYGILGLYIYIRSLYMYV